MAKERRQEGHGEDAAWEAADAALQTLSELEERLCLTCLRFFRGDWDLYLDFLGGVRATEEQRRLELPVVAKLRERDQRVHFLELMLEDEVVASAEHLDFDGLLRLWDLAMLLDPEADPFYEPRRLEPDLRDADLDDDGEPRSLH